MVLPAAVLVAVAAVVSVVAVVVAVVVSAADAVCIVPLAYLRPETAGGNIGADSD